MQITAISKITEGEYRVTSLPCPQCKGAMRLDITGDKLFLYHQGGFVQDVFPNQPLEIRERFLSGYCQPCFDELFPDDDDEGDN